MWYTAPSFMVVFQILHLLLEKPKKMSSFLHMSCRLGSDEDFSQDFALSETRQLSQS